jgi:hypothetical protein
MLVFLDITQLSEVSQSASIFVSLTVIVIYELDRNRKEIIIV